MFSFDFNDFRIILSTWCLIIILVIVRSHPQNFLNLTVESLESVESIIVITI